MKVFTALYLCGIEGEAVAVGKFIKCAKAFSLTDALVFIMHLREITGIAVNTDSPGYHFNESLITDLVYQISGIT